MSHRAMTVIGVTLLLAVAFAPAARAGRVEGEVIAVQERVQTRSGGELQELRIRTRQGEEMRLRLGAPEDCPGCVDVGDRVRVRTCAGGPVEGARLVRRMRVEGSGERYAFRNRRGDLLPDDRRGRVGGGAGERRGDFRGDRDRDRQRAHRPGPAGGGRRGGSGGGRG